MNAPAETLLEALTTTDSAAGPAGDPPGPSEGGALRTLLNETDFRIASLLSEAPRMPSNEIARRLGLSDYVVRGRLQNLEQSGALRVVGRPNHFHFGYAFSAILAINTEFGDLERVGEHVRSLREIVDSTIVAGRFDIFAWTILRARDELRALHQKLAGAGGIRNCETLVVLNNYKAVIGRVSRDPLPSPAPFMRQKGDRVALDTLDLRICRHLLRNARIPGAQIARQVGAPLTTVHRKMHRLFAQDTIRPEILPDLSAFGFTVQAVIGLRTAPDHVPVVAQHLVSLPDVNYLARVAGRYDLVARIIVPDLDDMQRFLDVDLPRVAGIDSVEPLTVLETALQRFVRVES
jgi:DNA-binding Lrp family transcriptional regulator